MLPVLTSKPHVLSHKHFSEVSTLHWLHGQLACVFYIQVHGWRFFVFFTYLLLFIPNCKLISV